MSSQNADRVCRRFLMDQEAALVIAEFDPFHEGHRYILEAARKACQGGPVIALMSPDFVQRGGPAVEDKYTRTQAALEAGYSCVLELPVRCASGSAGIFARAGVDLAAALGIVKVLCFGSESGDLPRLQALADIFANEDPAFSAQVRSSLKSGASYPAALETALRKTSFSSESGIASKASFSSGSGIASKTTVSSEKSSVYGYGADDLIACLQSPNDRLSIEYLRALKDHPQIRPYTVRRRPGVTASQIRSARLEAGIPGMYMDDFSSALLTRILEEGRDRLTDFQDVSDDMAARIWSAKDQDPRFDALAAAVKTRTWTRTRVDRALTHILLGIRKSAYTPPSFVRVLGFAASFEPYLSEMSRRFPGTLILRTSRDAKALSESERARFEEDLRASELYRSVRMIKYPGADLKPERSRGVIIL